MIGNPINYDEKETVTNVVTSIMENTYKISVPLKSINNIPINTIKLIFKDGSLIFSIKNPFFQNYKIQKL